MGFEAKRNRSRHKSRLFKSQSPLSNTFEFDLVISDGVHSNSSSTVKHLYNPCKKSCKPNPPTPPPIPPPDPSSFFFFASNSANPFGCLLRFRFFVAASFESSEVGAGEAEEGAGEAEAECGGIEEAILLDLEGSEVVSRDVEEVRGFEGA